MSTLEAPLAEACETIRLHVSNIYDDVQYMLGHAFDVPIPAPKTAREYWKNVRTACAFSQDILPERLNNISTDDLASRYGKEVLAAFSQKGFRHKGAYPGDVCSMSENYYCKLFDCSGARTIPPAVPLVITQNGEVAGLMKFRRIPTILSFVDNPEQGLYPGVISTPAQPELSAALEDMVRQTKHTSVVRLEDIARTPNSIEGLRLSTFALDSGTLAIFGTLLKTNILSLETMRAKTNALIGKDRKKILIPGDVAQKILWQRGVKDGVKQ